MIGLYILRALAIAILVASCSPTLSQPSAALQTQPSVSDARGRIDFSEPAIGALVAEIPASATNASDDPDCEFGQQVQPVCFLSDGVLIIGIEGVVVAKTVNVLRRPSSALPYGLGADDTPGQALRRLRVLLELPVEGFDVPYGGLAITTPHPVRNAGGVLVFLMMTFDPDNRISAVTVIDASFLEAFDRTGRSP